MSTSLSRVECKKHLLLFSASTPVGAITSYLAFSFFGSKQVDGVGTALLISVSISRENVAASTSLIWVIPGRKFSLCGNRAAASLS
jgi:hypothetical protein